MKKKRYKINKEQPFKIVAAGFPIMRFSTYELAHESFEKFQGPGGCLLANDRTGVIDYKFLKKR